MMGMILMYKKKYMFLPLDIVAVIVNITLYSSEIEGRNRTGIKKFSLSIVMKRILEMNRITSKNCFTNFTLLSELRLSWLPVAARSSVGLRPLACRDCGFESRRWMAVTCECCVL